MLFAIIISVVFALIFAGLLMYVFNRRGPGPGSGLLFLFLILFVFSWVGGTYIVPSGPVAWGQSWLGYAGVAFFIMLLLAAVMPASPRRPKSNPNLKVANDLQSESEAETMFSVTFGIFFWILIVTLLILAFAGAFYSGGPKVPPDPAITSVI